MTPLTTSASNDVTVYHVPIRSSDPWSWGSNEPAENNPTMSRTNITMMEANSPREPPFMNRIQSITIKRVGTSVGMDRVLPNGHEDRSSDGDVTSSISSDLLLHILQQTARTIADVADMMMAFDVFPRNPMQSATIDAPNIPTAMPRSDR